MSFFDRFRSGGSSASSAGAVADEPSASVASSDAGAGDAATDVGSMAGPSNFSLKAERAGINAKKWAARGLDTALFAPLHAVDQLSILDIHAQDAANFALTGKTWRQRQKQDIDSPLDKDLMSGDLGKTVKGRERYREIGRTGYRDTASTGRNIFTDVSNLENSKPRTEWGKESLGLGVNPVKELRSMGMPKHLSPNRPENQRLEEIKQTLADRKAAKAAG